MLDIILLSLAVCVDSFGLSLAMSAKKIKIEWLSLFIISFVNCAALGAGLFLFELFEPIENAPKISGILLFVIALVSLTYDKLKEKIKPKENRGFLMNLFVDKTKADKDNSKRLSPKEALLLSLMLSVDSLSVGMSVGLTFGTIKKLICVFVTLILGIILLITGVRLARRLPQNCFSGISGLILLILAIVLMR